MLDEQILFDEIPAIFNVAMEGLRRLMTRGRFDPPAAARDATKRLHDEADPIMLWLDDDDRVYQGADQEAMCDDVRRKYVNWCKRNGYQPLASGPFGGRMKQLGITRHRHTIGSSRPWYYHGIAVMLDERDL